MRPQKLRQPVFSVAWTPKRAAEAVARVERRFGGSLGGYCNTGWKDLGPGVTRGPRGVTGGQGITVESVQILRGTSPGETCAFAPAGQSREGGDEPRTGWRGELLV